MPTLRGMEGMTGENGVLSCFVGNFEHDSRNVKLHASACLFLKNGCGPQRES